MMVIVMNTEIRGIEGLVDMMVIVMNTEIRGDRGTC